MQTHYAPLPAAASFVRHPAAIILQASTALTLDERDSLLDEADNLVAMLAEWSANVRMTPFRLPRS